MNEHQCDEVFHEYIYEADILYLFINWGDGLRNRPNSPGMRRHPCADNLRTGKNCLPKINADWAP